MRLHGCPAVRGKTHKAKMYCGSGFHSRSRPWVLFNNIYEIIIVKYVKFFIS